MTARRRGRPTWRFRAGAALVSSVVALGVAEVGFRAFWMKRLTVGSGIEDAHFHHRLKRSATYRYRSKEGEFDVTVRTNRYGLRGPDPAMPKPPGVVRLLLLGDSFTFGFPVRDEETFGRLIEEGLRRQGRAVEVINGGVSSYSPTLHYVSLRDQYLAFEPDAVILWYDLGDLQDDYWYQKNLVYDEQGRIARADPRYVNGRFSLWEWCTTHSALAKYLNSKVVRTVGKLRVLGLRRYVQTKLRGERAKVAIGRLKAEQRAQDLLEGERFLLVREFATEELVAPYWELSARYLRLIRELLAGRDIPLFLGIYPYGIVIGPDQWAEGRRSWGFEPGRTYDAELFVSLLERFSSQEGVPLINTFGRFREAAGRAKLFYDWDGHMTPAGHRVVAEAVLADRRLLSALGRR